MKKVKIIVLIGLVMIGAVYAGTRPEELTREEKNKILVEMAIGAMNKGDWDLMAGLYSPRYVKHRSRDVFPETWEQFELGCRTARQKYPTARIEIQDIVAEGDKVAVRCKTVVTYKEKDFRGRTETARMEFTEIDLFRIQDYRIVEEWCEYDYEEWKTKLRMLSYVKTWK